jgi:hypothetical protein
MKIEGDPNEKNWREAEDRLSDFSETGFQFNDTELLPWYNPDYNRLARIGHPLYHLSVGLLVRHGMYEDPDGLSPKQRFDMARKGGVKVPDWMDQDPLRESNQ